MTKFSIYFIVLFCTILQTAGVQASDWGMTFVPERLNAYIPAVNSRIIVIQAGKKVEGQDASLVLQDAFRKAPKVDFVMSSEVLGNDVADLDDKTIVQKCGDLPIDYVVIVRVFEGTSTAAPIGVVMMYQKDEQVVGAINAKMGEAINFPNTTSEKNESDRTTATATVQPTKPQPPTQPVPVPQKTANGDNYNRLVEYDNNRILFKSWALVSINDGQHLGTWEVPYHGKYNERLEGARFFEVVQRPDLVKEFQTRKKRRKKLLIAGAILTAAGFASLSVGMKMKFKNCGTDCSSYSHVPVLGLGGGMMLTGVILVPVGLFFKTNPVEPAEMYQLAAKHNESHQKRLKLSDEEIRKYLNRRKVSGLILGPTISQNGMGFFGSIRF